MNKPKAIYLLVTLSTFVSLILSSHVYSENNTKIVSNDPTGKLFIKQATGDLNNCGPITALVARQFTTQDFKVKNLSRSIAAARILITPTFKESDDNNDEEIGDTSPFDSRWWNISDIQRYLTKHHIQASKLHIKQGTNALLEELDNGHIIIINVNMNDLPLNSGKNAIGKPYLTFPIPGGWGHFMVITGYQYVNETLVFQIHDSISKQGKNRLFYATNIIKAIKRYYPDVIVVKKTEPTTVTKKPVNKK